MNSNWSYSPETKIWVVTSVTLTFDLWPWPFAWTLPWSNVITPENFMMIWWWEHSQKGVTDGQTDRRTDGQTDRRTDRRTENTIHRAAWSQLKIASIQFHAKPLSTLKQFYHECDLIEYVQLELSKFRCLFFSIWYSDNDTDGLVQD